MARKATVNSFPFKFLNTLFFAVEGLISGSLDSNGLLSYRTCRPTISSPYLEHEKYTKSRLYAVFLCWAAPFSCGWRYQSTLRNTQIVSLKLEIQASARHALILTQADKHTVCSTHPHVINFINHAPAVHRQLPYLHPRWWWIRWANTEGIELLVALSLCARPRERGRTAARQQTDTGGGDAREKKT